MSKDKGQNQPQQQQKKSGKPPEGFKQVGGALECGSCGAHVELKDADLHKKNCSSRKPQEEPTDE